MRSRRSFVSLFFFALLITLMLFCIACSSWERTTFQTLSTSRAVINQAVSDYQAKTISNTAAAYKAINDARDLQKTVVDAFVTYEQMKTSGASVAALSTQQNVVTAALSKLPTLIADVKLLYSDAKQLARAERAPPIRDLAAALYVWRFEDETVINGSLDQPLDLRLNFELQKDDDVPILLRAKAVRH